MPGVEIPGAIVVVADACSLERSLLLVGQVLRREKPTCLVLSMYDELKARHGAPARMPWRTIARALFTARVIAFACKSSQ